MMKLRFGILTLILFVFSYSCIDEITLDIDNDTQFVVINGLITDEAGEFTVTVNLSPKIVVGNDNILVPIPGAVVSINDDQARSITFTESVDDPGTYTGMI